MGRKLYERRLHKEDTREQRLGGLVTICPMRIARPVVNMAFWATGLWKRAHRQFLDPVVREHSFAIAGLPEELHGFTVLHLSDLHLDLDTRLTDIIAERIDGLRYDMAAITGDFNNYTVHTDGSALAEMRRIMPKFSAPVLGVLGNHDSLRDVPAMEDMGIRVLLNESINITRGRASIAFAGIDDPNIFGTHNLEKALGGGARASVRVLLSHSPCIHNDASRLGVDIVLCGHIHGGQFCLPGGRMLPAYRDRSANHVLKGYWKEGATQGWTSSGTGSCGVPLRLNCPPEIVLHRLTPA